MEPDATSHNDDASGQIHALLHGAVDREASDVHVVPGYPATYRVHGRLEPADAAVLRVEAVRGMVESILPPRLLPRLSDGKNFDCSISLDHHGVPCRFRANVFLSQGDWCASLRHVPNDIPSFEWMGFSQGFAERLISHRNGLVIITGVTGSGKTTTLAALVNLLNQKGAYRVITVEEPIEYVHKPISSSMVVQREVGRDVDSFYDGLKYGLRQDPDVILIGEIRDRDTAQMALSAAETGHLILTTLHTKDAKGAVTRFVDLFPHEAQDDVRTQLGLSLRSVVSQHLLPSATADEKRVLAMEILHVNHPVRIAIKFGKIESIESAIQTGKRDGMSMLDDDLQRLVSMGRITPETARRFAKDPDSITGF
ncbi:MAG: type IV pilus twitching motility protein PilT [Planctomycetota bacterium]|jgi:twitching motility protein PilT